MARRFDAFVLFAEMRTGSNHLEEALNGYSDITGLGEVFNPTFIGQQNRFELHGFDMDRREADPLGLLDAIIGNTKGLPGFRLFHDHDQRVVNRVLPDPRIAKVILTRNPVESYVSRKIAAATGQWRLTDMQHAKTAKIRFDAAEFGAWLDATTQFRHHLRRGLQKTGQVAFPIRYEDITEPDVVSGLATFLGSAGRSDGSGTRLKKQNPRPLRDKVENYPEMVEALADLDRFGLDHLPELEPDRTAGVPDFVAHPRLGLLFCPIAGAPEEAVLDWMGRLGDVGRDALKTRMNRKQLRLWMKENPGFRSFTVLRHPAARAYGVFNRFILSDGHTAHARARKVLRQRYGLPIPDRTPDESWTAADQKAAFSAFVNFLKGNLAGQTSLAVARAWASQTEILRGIGHVIVPQAVIREEAMKQALPFLARDLGVTVVPEVADEPLAGRVGLASIHDDKIEQAVMEAYRRDYVGFGFGTWNADQAAWVASLAVRSA